MFVQLSLAGFCFGGMLTFSVKNDAILLLVCRRCQFLFSMFPMLGRFSLNVVLNLMRLLSLLSFSASSSFLFGRCSFDKLSLDDIAWVSSIDEIGFECYECILQVSIISAYLLSA